MSFFVSVGSLISRKSAVNKTDLIIGFYIAYLTNERIDSREKKLKREGKRKQDLEIVLREYYFRLDKLFVENSGRLCTSSRLTNCDALQLFASTPRVRIILIRFRPVASALAFQVGATRLVVG